MKKQINGRDSYYIIAWSPYYKYDKYTAMKILPHLAGIICLSHQVKNNMEHLFFFNCWRDGLQTGLKKAMDPEFSKYKALFEKYPPGTLHYRYTEVDTGYKDIEDILFWLIRTYRPAYNNHNYEDSKRYVNINVKEIDRNPDSVTEKIPGIRR